MAALPQDSHVHTEWSWDTVRGSMEASCARAVGLGLPSIAFTEHVDPTHWKVPASLVPLLPEHFRPHLRSDNVLAVPDLDVRGYLECVRHCRERFPGLRIVTGLELSEPHWYPEETAELLGSAEFERVLGSVHALPYDGGHWEVSCLFDEWPTARLVRRYLAEVRSLAESTGPFGVLAHIDYPIRYWPQGTEPYDPFRFEEEFRGVLGVLARSGRALEVNTRVPLHAEVVRWWYEAGGDAVSFGSDAHEPDKVGHGFAAAVAIAESCGFHPGRTPHDLWTRRATV
jgi:histidinol-phosphatase (PHP family)